MRWTGSRAAVAASGIVRRPPADTKASMRAAMLSSLGARRTVGRWVAIREDATAWAPRDVVAGFAGSTSAAAKSASESSGAATERLARAGDCFGLASSGPGTAGCDARTGPEFHHDGS